MSDHRDLVRILEAQMISYAAAQCAADGILAAGWRPPAPVVDTREALAELRTGTVIRFPDGDIGSVDHGPHGEWTGLFTRVHLLLPGGGYVGVGDLPMIPVVAEVVWSPTQKAGSK